MDQNQAAPLHPGVAHKADAVLDAISQGHRRIGAIATATRLSETTVIRVAALLRDRGRIDVVRNEQIELFPSAAG